MRPADIVFSVKTPPRAGYLVMLSHGTTAAEPTSLDPVHSFSQEAVNAGRVLYLHSHPEAWSDAFSLDVASGLGAPLKDVYVELEVLPAAIPLEAQNFSVPEGGTRTLAPPLLRITGPYFPTLPGLDLQVLEPPQHGALRREEGPQDRTLSTFSWKEVCCHGGPRGAAQIWGQSGRALETPSLGICTEKRQGAHFIEHLCFRCLSSFLLHWTDRNYYPHFLHSFIPSLWKKGLSPTCRN